MTKDFSYLVTGTKGSLENKNFTGDKRKNGTVCFSEILLGKLISTGFVLLHHKTMWCGSWFLVLLHGRGFLSVTEMT